MLILKLYANDFVNIIKTRFPIHKTWVNLSLVVRLLVAIIVSEKSAEM